LAYLKNFRAVRHENKEKRLFYFGLLPIQIQLFDVENPKNPKFNYPYCIVGWVDFGLFYIFIPYKSTENSNNKKFFVPLTTSS
jgi:hypothetical protein